MRLQGDARRTTAPLGFGFRGIGPACGSVRVYWKTALMPASKARRPDDQGILRTLSTAKYRYVRDQRGPERGALWVITGRPFDRDRRFFEDLNRKGYDFRFSRNGSKATDHKAAWWWQPEDRAQTLQRLQKIITRRARNGAQARDVLSELEAKSGQLSHVDLATVAAAMPEGKEFLRSALLNIARNRRKRPRRAPS